VDLHSIQSLLWNLGPAILAVAIALGVCRLLVARFGLPPAGGRFHTIDGLRGYLAFMVFLHHSSIWYYYTHFHSWRLPESWLYIYFGSGSVDLFFMITAFLFFSKLIDSPSRKISWLRLYVSRVMRLTPLYITTALLLFLIVGAMTGFHLKQPVGQLSTGVMKWLGFTIYGSPDLNGVVNTRNIVAGVTWSLPYEWWFYLSLPVLGLLYNEVRPRFWIFFGLAGTAAGAHWALHGSELALFSTFLGGILAAILVREKKFCGLVLGPLAAVACIAFLAIGPGFHIPANSIHGVIPLIFAFIIIACGNDLFGILTWQASRMLGEMTYGMYLLHGMILFVFFQYVVGVPWASGQTLVMHWLLIFSLTPVLVMVSYLAFRVIEAPSMASVPAITGWIQEKLGLEREGVSLPPKLKAKAIGAGDGK
jgi:peptidoglycan/LPS O-acetylase OafA/YrhL